MIGYGEPPVRRAPGQRRNGPDNEQQSPLVSGVISHGRVGVDNTSCEMGDTDGVYYGDETTVMKRIENHSQRGNK